MTVETLATRALLDLKANRPEAALADYEAALNLAPRDASLQFGRGVAKRHLANWLKAMPIWWQLAGFIDATGQEVTYAYVNAALRDWARLGLMLAHDGTWSGRSIVPRDWLQASFANPVEIGSALSKYGYHIWLSADLKRFFLEGLRGQFVLVDPDSKLVLVQTALSSDGFLDLGLSALWTAARAQLR